MAASSPSFRWKSNLVNNCLEARTSTPTPVKTYSSSRPKAAHQLPTKPRGTINLLAFVRETTVLNSNNGHKEANPC